MAPLLNSRELKAAAAAIGQAGAAVKAIYQNDFSFSFKDNNEPVCQADLKSNRLIEEGLKPLGYPILSEESADDLTRLKSGKIWIVDPLDGTSDFVNKKGEFTVMIGLVENGRPILGLVYSPLEDILYYAAAGEGAYEKKGEKVKKLKVSSAADLKRAKIFISRYHFGPEEKDFLARLGAGETAACGSSKKLCLIAAGQGEAAFNLSDKTWEWDVAAADIILSEAGGRLTDKFGEKISYNKNRPNNSAGYVASNGILHAAVMGELKM